MKRRISLFLVMVVMMAMVVSCAGFISNSYTTLSISKSFYDSAMKATADFQRDGLIDQAKRDQINKLAKIYKEAHNVAVDALEVYARTKAGADKDKVVIAMAGVASKWVSVATLINAIKSGTVQPTLKK